MKIMIGELNDKIAREAPQIRGGFLDRIAPQRAKGRIEKAHEWFTGFKGFLPDIYLFDDPSRTVDIDPNSVRYYAQWVFWLGNEMLYVNLPGMQSGKIENGAKFEVGETWFTRDSEQGELQASAFRGLQKLRELIDLERNAA